MSLLAAIIGAAGVITASAFTAWATANGRVNDIDTKVQVVEERENNHYMQLKEDLESIDKKLDLLIKTQ